MTSSYAPRSESAESSDVPDDQAPGAKDGLTALLPAFNEETGIGQTLERLLGALRSSSDIEHFEVIVVDDGSTDATPAAIEPYVEGGVRIVRHAQNRGYGAALKTGIEAAHYDWIMILDADGTYDERCIDELFRNRTGNQMVVAARTGPDVAIPLLRRPAKWVLRRLASYLARCPIPDLNSGQRLIRREAFREFRHLLPNGFSFTTTITLAMLSAGYSVVYVPINYRRRKGISKIRPLRDSADFLVLILRTILYFEPLRVFLPAALVFFALSAGVGVGSLLITGRLMDVTTVLLFVTGIQLLGLGLIADLVNRRRQ